MADPTAVNSQITDAVSQSTVMVLGSSPAQALAALFQVAAHATSLSLHNAVASQQNMNQTEAAVTAQCVELLLRRGEAPKHATPTVSQRSAKDA